MGNSVSFMSGGGEMGKLIRAFDWASTPIGSPDSWPQSLRVTVRLMLNSQHPMFIFWGEDLIQFYNDAYRQTMGPQMHPSALGARGRESWADIWPIIGPQIATVMAGEGATWNVDQMVPINRHGKPEEVWWTYGYSPIDDPDTGVGGVLVVCNDVTEQHMLTESFKNQTQRLAQQFEQAPGFIAVLRGPEHIFELTNAAYRQLTGERDLTGKPVREALPDIEGQGFYELLDQVYKTGKEHVGTRTPLTMQPDPDKPPKNLFLDFVYQPIFESDGSVSGIFVEGQNVTEHVEIEDRLILINNELRHRAKNTLAMIGAVASQTLRNAAGTEAMSAFHARLAAFGAAHDALAARRDATGAVDEVINMALQPHIPSPDRYTISGPHIVIGSKQALSLALAMHELATNAAKYGAISNERGRVAVRWWLDGNDAQTFHMEWTEVGGPEIAAPNHNGFGSRLIKSVLAADFEAQVDMSFDSAGFTLTLAAPVEKLLSPAD